MKIQKMISKLKLPNFFASKNSTRKYKIEVKGTQGTIVFTEFAKKEFVLESALRAAKLLKSRGIKAAGKIQKSHVPATWNVTKDKWKMLPKSFMDMYFNRLKEYVNDVEKNVRKKHAHFTIYNHELESLTFEEVEENYKVTALVKIWVSV